MKDGWRSLPRVLGLAWALGADPVQAADAARDALERAGSLLGTMKGLMQTYRDGQYKRPPLTADARAASARTTAARLAGYRHQLVNLAPKFDSGSRFATDVDRLLKRWPDSDAIRQELLDENWGERLQTVITGLWLQVPDSRVTWKTLFPWFRP